MPEQNHLLKAEREGKHVRLTFSSPDGEIVLHVSDHDCFHSMIDNEPYIRAEAQAA
mgnify:CR=1 FL=1